MDPLLLDIPEEIETERKIVRVARPGDGPGVNAAVLDSLAELRPWMPWAKVAPTLEDSEAHSRRCYAKFQTREDLAYRGWLKNSGVFVLGSGLHRIDWSVPRFEIGYFVRTSFAGRGYASEMVRAMERLAFDTLKAARVEIRCDDRNERSWRVAERCGFALEGVLRANSRGFDGSLRDTRVYARIAGATTERA